LPLTEWSQRFLASTRGRVIDRLRHGSATVDEMAQLLGLTPNGVRAHLVALERDGWIRPEGVRRAGPGKPASVYGLSPEAEPLLSNAYRPLLLALLGTLAAEESPARVEAFMTEAGRRLAAGLRDDGKGSVAARAVRLLEMLGAAVEVDEVDGRLVIRGMGCPVGEAVAIEPRVCHAVTSLLAGVLDVEVHDACDHGVSPRCRFEVGAARDS
jgi:predicted ArsR family transcriptional regulator